MKTLVGIIVYTEITFIALMMLIFYTLAGENK